MLTKDIAEDRFWHIQGKLFYKPKAEITWREEVWNERFAGSECNSKSRGYYRVCITIHGKEEKYLVHRIIFLMVKGFMPKSIDHIDHNKINNNIDNLREADHSANSKNMSMYSNNTSGFTGVSWSKTNKAWKALIKACGESIHLGYFDKKEDAINARNKANVKYGFHKNHGLRT